MQLRQAARGKSCRQNSYSQCIFSNYSHYRAPNDPSLLIVSSKFDELSTASGLGDVPSPYSHLSFSSYNVIAPRDPALNGKISHRDRNCASSPPNALIGSRGNTYDPNAVHGAYFEVANATAMTEDSLEPYFALSKFKIKPLDRPPEPTTTLITVIGYKHDSNQTVKFEVAFEQDFVDPLAVNLKYFSRENWENLSGVEILADYGVDALDWEFCVDDLELWFSYTTPEIPMLKQQDQIVLRGEN